jgi:hypothetical protein
MWLLIALMALLGAETAPAPPSTPPPDPRVEARSEVRKLVAGIQEIERIRAKTPPDALDASCVEEKLAEARAGLQIASAELARLDDSLASHDAELGKLALHRLHLLVDRGTDLIHATRICATDEQSTIDTTQVDVEIAPSVPPGDPTLPPSSFVRPERPPQN